MREHVTQGSHGLERNAEPSENVLRGPEVTAFSDTRAKMKQKRD